MNIRNTDTGEVIDLRHPFHSQDVMPDLTAGDEGIKWNREEDIREASGEAIAWWQEYVRADAEYEGARKNLLFKLSHQDISEFEDDILDAQIGCADMAEMPAACLAVAEKWWNQLYPGRTAAAR